jgi:predicted phage tail component-like protein
MANPTFNNFSLQDDTYVTKDIQFRDVNRRIESEEISRRLKNRILNTKVQPKVIMISGIIIANTSSLLQSAVDDLQKNLMNKEGDLVIEDGRTFKATVEDISMPERSYTQTAVEFAVKFVANTPYSISDLKVGTFIIASGINSKTIITTISGTVPNRPVFRFVLPSGVGTSPVFRFDVQNQATGNTVTISGTLTAATELVVNYERFLVTTAAVDKDYVGQMDEFDAGVNTWLITVSGKNDGIRGSLEYNARYW